jgi:hypothetical protein
LDSSSSGLRNSLGTAREPTCIGYFPKAELRNQNTPLWHKDYFELEAKENQQMQKGAFPELPYLSNTVTSEA